jgi:DNA-binding LacI/PurR family transcriptional regulator
MKGYAEALKKYKIPVEKKWIVHCNFDFVYIKKALIKLLKSGPKPNAILASSERIAISCFEVLKEMGLRIPADIAIAGFVDNPATRFIDPPLTTIRLPTFDIGQSAARLLISMIGNDTLQHPYKTIELKTTMEVRASSMRKEKEV